jgi:hypothetical protein
MPERLLPASIAGRIPHPCHAPGYGSKAVAYAKLVGSWQGRRWYVSLYDPDEGYCWTKYVGPEGAALMGIHLATLEQLRGPLGERVELDRTFTPCPLAECEPEMSVGVVRAEETL